MTIDFSVFQTVSFALVLSLAVYMVLDLIKDFCYKTFRKGKKF